MMTSSLSPRSGITLTGVALTAVLTVAFSVRAQVPVPSFGKAFIPGTIGPGSVATLEFEIANQDTQPVTDLAFTDNLPAGVSIASPANAATTCGGTLTAPAGGGTISFTDGAVGASSSCSISVDVTSATVGTHTNVSGDLTSSAGNSGPATADLAAVTTRPGFRKSFSPSSVPLGGRSTLTLTVDNTSNSADVFSLSFVDQLPPGMIIASPANASTDCESGAAPADLIATPGTSLISLNAFGFAPSFPVLGADLACTVTVDVIGGGVGLLGNTTGELSANVGGPTVSCGKASATLDVFVDQISVIKSFTDDPVPPGGTVSLEFTVSNFDRNNPATSIAFTDDLDATLSGLVATGLPAADVCGAGSQLSGTGFLTLTGGSLPAQGSCTFSTTLQVPGAATTGIYPNTTSTVSADIGGSGVTGSPAADLLFVAPAPTLTKEFIDDPVGAGESVTLEFTITNTSSTSSATDIAFEDIFYVGLPTASAIPTPGFCGAGSTATFTPLSNPPGLDATPARLTVTGGNLAASDSCTFSMTLDVAPGVPSGIYPNSTTPITATVGGESVIGNPAVDDLVVVGGSRLLKEFTDDPASPGGTVNLEFTLSHDPLAVADATGIAFTDDLDAALAGLTAMGLPVSDVCGAGSQISGIGVISFTGGTLAPGESCTFSVTLQVPGTAPAGPHTNTTSNVTATVAGSTTTENPASDDLMIAGLVLQKEFIDDPVFPGGTATLRFTVDNISPVSDATDIFFQDDLDDVIPTLAATGLPLADICGAGSSLTGTAGNTLLTLLAGNLTAGSSCTFDVTLQVPPGAASGTYINATSSFNANVGGSAVSFPNAADALVVSADRLALTKSFTDDPTLPGATATLEFTITNLDATLSATGISFTDDLDAALAGLAATGLPAADVCGAGSQLSGSSVLTLTGGSLAAGASCTFSVAVQVPAATAAGLYTNVTSQVTGDMGGFPVTGDPASDGLSVSSFTFGKAFGGPVPAGGTTTLSFTIENLDLTASAVGISFTDDLDAVVPGMTAVGLPATDVCGSGSVLTGTSVLALTGGVLGPGETCAFDVEVQIPASTPVGSYVNTTSALSLGGILSAEPATANLDVEQAAAGAAIPAANPVGRLVFIALLAAAALWLLRWKA